MQTSAISYRVADFLKQYPPFQYMEMEDLLDLAGHGRVKFHESDEFILWQGSPLPQHVFVIQQGSISIWQGNGLGEELCDMRGPGDVVGIDRYHGRTENVHSVKAASEVLLYALPADRFGQLLEKYPQAQRYIQAHDSVTANYSPVDQRKGHHETLLYEAIRRVEPPTCTPGNSLRAAARRMQKAGTTAIAAVDGDGHVAGVLTMNDIVRAVAADDFDAARSVEEFMDATPMTMAPDVTVSHAALALGSTGVVAVTQSGGPQSRLHGLLTVADLGPAFGDHPSEILLEIPRAPSLEALRRVNQRARSFALEYLTSPATVDWLAEFVHLADLAILKRIATLIPPPPGQFCWGLFGAAGRSESLPPVIQRSIVILGEGADHAAFTAWYQQVNKELVESGYIARKEHFTPEYSCASQDDWRERYTGWIRDPLTNSLHHARHLFDLRPALGDVAMWRQLEEALKEESRTHPAFVRLLANDCLSALPPITFFQDVVIDDSGVESDVFDLERTALRPLADVGRVFGIAAGRLLGASTQERFRLARTLLPEQESIFREASETLRVVLYQQARSGIRGQNNGGELSPDMLSHYDRQVLKSGFRSIHRLLEFTAEGSWLEAA